MCTSWHPPTQQYLLRDLCWFLWCVYDFNLSKPPCHYFNAFSFFLITDRSSLCPHNNPIFSSVCHIIPPLCLFVHFVMSCHKRHYDSVSLWSNLFLLFYLNCSIIMLLCSLQIWVNTSATRSVSVCTTQWGRALAVHHRRFLLERPVCFFFHCAACALVNLAFIFISEIFSNVSHNIMWLFWFTFCLFSPNSSTPKCGDPVLNSYTTGCHMGPSSSGCSKWGHTGLQGINNMSFCVLLQIRQTYIIPVSVLYFYCGEKKL